MKKHFKKKHPIDSVIVVLESDNPVDSDSREFRLRLSSRSEFNTIIELSEEIGVPALNIFSDCAELIKRHGGDISSALAHALTVIYTLADCRRAEILSEGSSNQ